VVLYELLVGRVPFTADTPYAIIHDHIFSPLPMPRALNPDLSEELERVLLKALAKDPDDRYQTVEQMVSALEAAYQSVKEAAEIQETLIAERPTEIMPGTPTEVSAQPEVPSAPEIVPPAGQAETIEREESPETPPISSIDATRLAEQAQRVKRQRKPRRPALWVAAAAAVFLGLAAIAIVLVITFGSGDVLGRGTPEGGSGTVLDDARRAADEGRPDEAVRLYQAAAEEDPHLAEAYLEGSDLLMQLRRADEALAFLQRGVESNPDDPALHTVLLEVATSTGSWDIVHKEATWLLRQSPEDPLLHALVGVAALEQGAPCEEVEAELHAALELDPDLPAAHFGMAQCQLQYGDVDAAREELRFVLESDSTPPLLRQRAEQLMERVAAPEGPGPLNEAFEALRMRAQQIPNDELRAQFLPRVDEAQGAWESRDRGRTLEILHAAKEWVDQHWEALGPGLAEDLMSGLDELIERASGP
jgi:tetratricopeptide (TPR) repeat protein